MRCPFRWFCQEVLCAGPARKVLNVAACHTNACNLTCSQIVQRFARQANGVPIFVKFYQADKRVLEGEVGRANCCESGHSHTERGGGLKICFDSGHSHTPLVDCYVLIFKICRSASYSRDKNSIPLMRFSQPQHFQSFPQNVAVRQKRTSLSSPATSIR